MLVFSLPDERFMFTYMEILRFYKAFPIFEEYSYQTDHSGSLFKWKVNFGASLAVRSAFLLNTDTICATTALCRYRGIGQGLVDATYSLKTH